MRNTNTILALILFIFASFAAGAIGSLFTAPAVQPGGWYGTLPKPPWTPPSWVFGPAWSTLYLLMGIAAWLVWRARGHARIAAPMALFTIQLILNAAWSIVFFGQRQVGFSMVIIVLLWLAILLTLISFWRVNRVAGWLLVPYLAWVSYASTLNWGIWRNLAGG
jgi:benzodiazapine receptor